MHISTQEWSILTRQHPLATSELPVVMVPLMLFSDDTSGNKSKKWNKFDVWYLLLAGLPWKENTKIENIHVLTCSNRVSAIEMAHPIVDDLLALENEGVVVYDALNQREVLVVAPVISGIADNPRASEMSNHLGNSANLFCRKCEVSIMLQSHTSMNYACRYQFCIQVDSREDPSELGDPRSKLKAIEQIEIIRQQKTTKAKESKKKEFGLKDAENPLFKLSVDLYRLSFCAYIKYHTFLNYSALSFAEVFLSSACTPSFLGRTSTSLDLCLIASQQLRRTKFRLASEHSTTQGSVIFSQATSAGIISHSMAEISRCGPRCACLLCGSTLERMRNKSG